MVDAKGLCFPERAPLKRTLPQARRSSGFPSARPAVMCPTFQGAPPAPGGVEGAEIQALGSSCTNTIIWWDIDLVGLLQAPEMFYLFHQFF